jgi:hypothetical protein
VERFQKASRPSIHNWISAGKGKSETQEARKRRQAQPWLRHAKNRTSLPITPDQSLGQAQDRTGRALPAPARKGPPDAGKSAPHLNQTRQTRDKGLKHPRNATGPTPPTHLRPAHSLVMMIVYWYLFSNHFIGSSFLARQREIAGETEAGKETLRVQ